MHWANNRNQNHEYAARFHACPVLASLSAENGNVKKHNLTIDR